MKILIHDLSEDEFNSLGIDDEDTIIVKAKEKAAHCLGCFSCWFRSPGECVIKDKLQNMGEALGKAKEIIIISQNCYGGYSYAVKKVLDRSIATSLPLFTYRGGKIHHILRYKNRPKLKVCLYGPITDFEKETAQELVTANSINMGATSAELITAESYVNLFEVFI